MKQVSYDVQKSTLLVLHFGFRFQTDKCVHKDESLKQQLVWLISVVTYFECDCEQRGRGCLSVCGVKEKT